MAEVATLLREQHASQEEDGEAVCLTGGGAGESVGGWVGRGMGGAGLVGGNKERCCSP